MTYDSIGIVLIFLKEVSNARESYLVDIAVNLLLGHSYAMVRDSQCASLLVKVYAHARIAYLTLEVALLGESLEFLRSINGIADHLTQEYLMI